MSGNLSRRLSAVEAKSAPARRVFRFQPDDLDEAALAAWHEAEVAPAVAAGLHVIIYSWANAEMGSRS